MSPLDPFYFKRFHKLDPRRLAYTAFVRGSELISRMRFARYLIPKLPVDGGVRECPDFASDETAVNETQMQLLIESVQATEKMGGAIVEVGAFRGVTTALLAERTSRRYFAVDPYIGYGGAKTDRLVMLKRIQNLKHVEHLELTSGEAIQKISGTPLSFVFIDAVHDYVNARFDGVSWGEQIRPQGLLAFHDTDSRRFPGVQRVVWNLLKQKSNYELFGHVPGLVVLRKQNH